MLVIDRETGETERIPLSDRNADASIAMGAASARMTEETARDVLECGGDIVTPGFIRRYAE